MSGLMLFLIIYIIPAIIVLIALLVESKKDRRAIETLPVAFIPGINIFGLCSLICETYNHLRQTYKISLK